MQQINVSALCVIALLLAACGSARPPLDATGLKAVLGQSLGGIAGKTMGDQQRLDIRFERECAAKLWPEEC